MLFMVIERFEPSRIAAVGERFARNGRMLPDGVDYHGSWIDAAGNRCFQVMESASFELLYAWTSRWDDLVDFEIVPVVTSSEYWASR